MLVMSTLFASYLLLSGTMFLSEAVASEDLHVVDAGHSFERRHRVLVASSPGVNPVVTLRWEEALENGGFDAWRLSLGANVDTPERLFRAISDVEKTWANTEYSIVAHGYIGRFFVDANVNAQRMVLVGAPLGPQVTDTRIGLPPNAGVVLEGLPWPAELLGRLPQVELPRAIAEMYLQISASSVAVDPDAEVLLISSGEDVVAPPECVRLPSVDWTDRSFVRVEGVGPHSSTHGDLLRNPTVERQMLRFLRKPKK